MTRIALLITVLAACSKDNPYFCDDACQMTMVDADVGDPACESNDDCSAVTPVCDTANSVCVACTAADNGACGNMLCSTKNECQRCVSHNQCGESDACDASTGECIDTSMVAYVVAGGTNGTTCTKAAPCGTLTYAATQKPYVKLQSNIDEVVSLASVSTTVLAAPGTTIKRTASNGPIVTVSGTSNVTLTNVVIRDGATALGHGVSIANGDNAVVLNLQDVAIVANTGYGLSVGGGTLTMSRCIVANNTSGGGTITGDFDITNSMILTNGTSSSITGGLTITPGATKKIFSFNTVAGNDASNSATGINCTLSMTLTNTLVSDNVATANCAFEYSMFDIGVSVTGTNKTGNPQFRNTLPTAPLAADYYRIANNSDAIDSAAPTSAVMTDIDGDVRPQTGADIGADEYN